MAKTKPNPTAKPPAKADATTGDEAPTMDVTVDSMLIRSAKVTEKDRHQAAERFALEAFKIRPSGGINDPKEIARWFAEFIKEFLRAMLETTPPPATPAVEPQPASDNAADVL